MRRSGKCPSEALSSEFARSGSIESRFPPAQMQVIPGANQSRFERIAV